MGLFSLKREAARRPYGDAESRIINSDSHIRPLSLLSCCPAYEPTRLITLAGSARELGVAAIYVKDESTRLGLQSFKALGGIYAVIETAMRHAGIDKPTSSSSLNQAAEWMRNLASGVTFATATDGNHGRAVAAGARLVGANARIYLPKGASSTRKAAIVDQGAQVVETNLNYDHVVALAKKQALANGWTLISDTSDDEDDPIAKLIMAGYCVIGYELRQQIDLNSITHVFVQGGVGGISAAISGYLADTLGLSRPAIVVVEPSNSNCLQVSARKGEIVQLPDLQPTAMAMLECGTPSAPAWQIVSNHCDHFMDISDLAAEMAVERFRRPLSNDEPIDTGPSGSAGFAGVQVACANIDVAKNLGLDNNSKVLVINTEGWV